jgi:hypothetical protein
VRSQKPRRKRSVAFRTLKQGSAFGRNKYCQLTHPCRAWDEECSQKAKLISCSPRTTGHGQGLL